MLVRYWMSPNAVTIGPQDSMQQAVLLMKEHDIRLLPVTHKNKIEGVISDRDLKRASASDATTLEIHELLYLLSKIRVADIMSRPAITVPVDFTIEETAALLLENKISGAPVVDRHGQLAGVITKDDLFRALVALTGLKKRGLHISLLLADQPGTIMTVANRVREAGGRIVSILTSYHNCEEGLRRVYFRVYNLDREQIISLLEAMRRDAEVLYFVDHRENRRVVFSE